MKKQIEKALKNLHFKKKWFKDKSGYWWTFKFKKSGIKYKLTVEDGAKGDYYMFLQVMTYSPSLTDDKKTGYERVTKNVLIQTGEDINTNFYYFFGN